MRFFTGLHSERLSQLDTEMIRIIDEQRSKRAAVQQIRRFMNQFELGSEVDLIAQLQAAEQGLAEAEQRRAVLETTRSVQTHPSDTLRDALRQLGMEAETLRRALAESTESITEQRALRAEFITAKVKAERVDQASRVLEGTRNERCPQCGSNISERSTIEGLCRLCGSTDIDQAMGTPLEMEALRRDLNERIDRGFDRSTRARVRSHVEAARTCGAAKGSIGQTASRGTISV